MINIRGYFSITESSIVAIPSASYFVVLLLSEVSVGAVLHCLYFRTTTNDNYPSYIIH